MLTHRFRTILGDIPADWCAAPLRALIAEHFAGDWGNDEGEQAVAVMRSTNFTNNGQLDFSDVATRYFPKEKAEQFELHQGDLLLERSGGGPDQPVGRIGFVENDIPGATVSNFVQVLRPDPEKVDPYFLGWALFELQRTGIVERVQQQSTQMRNLNWRDYQRLMLPRPQVDEQRRIAATLKLADDAIQKARIELDATRELKRSLMSSLFIAGMPSRHGEFQDTKIGPVPRGWTVRTIRSVLAEKPDSGTSPLSRPDPPGTPILNVSCIKDGVCSPADVTYVDVSKDEIDRYRTQVGDFFVLRGNGNRDYVGTGGLLRQTPDVDTIYSDKLIRLRFDAAQVVDRFVPYLWQSRAFLTRLQSKAESGSGLWMMSKRDICRELFACPPPGEQKEIVAVLDSIEGQLSAQEKKLQALGEVQHSLLQNLLTGKIRVPGETIYA
ncbi:restriction endonuclease subunit S [Paraburkholderia sp. JHI2823]|uniref:restriction endonuclease subunit S n=1 Tax=Paraburkholderia sp. JHI2823 TaxID=3112960 RepID=UPI00317F6388